MDSMETNCRQFFQKHSRSIHFFTKSILNQTDLSFLCINMHEYFVLLTKRLIFANNLKKEESFYINNILKRDFFIVINSF